MQPKCPQRHLRCLHRNNTQHVGPPKTHNLSATGSEAAQAVLDEGRYGLVDKTHPSCVRPGLNTRVQH